MAKTYPKKLTKQQFRLRNPGGSYQAYSLQYTKNRARFNARQTQPAAAPDPLAKLLAGLGQAPQLSDFLGDSGGDLAQATSLANAQYGMQQQSIQSAASQAASEARRQQQQLAQLAQEAAGMARGIGPQIQQTYQGAANAESSYGKGFSVGMQLLADKQAQQNTADLTKWGAPQAQIDQTAAMSQGAADPFYASGGYLPATSLGREGAAFSAAASMMPGNLLRMGQLDAADVARRAQATSSDSAQQLAALGEQRAAALKGILQDVQAQRLSTYEARRRAYEVDREWLTKVWATQQLANAPDPSQSNLTGYLTDQYGNVITDANGQPIPTYSAQQDMAQAQADAAAAAADARKKKADKRKAQKAAQATAQKNLTSARASLKSTMVSFAKGLVTQVEVEVPGGFFDHPTTKKIDHRPTYQEALQQVQAAYGTELADLVKRFNLRPAAIAQLIREALVAAGYTPSAASGHFPPDQSRVL